MSMDIQIIMTLLVSYPILSYNFHDGWLLAMIKPICPCHVLRTSAGTTPEPWSWPKTARVLGPFTMKGTTWNNHPSTNMFLYLGCQGYS